MNPGLPPPPPPRSIGWLRLMVWSIPTGISVALLFALEFLPPSLSPEGILLIAIGITGGLGYYDALLARQKQPMPGTSADDNIPRKVVLFTLLQFLVVPIFWLGIMAGFCALTGQSSS